MCIEAAQSDGYLAAVRCLQVPLTFDVWHRVSHSQQVADLLAAFQATKTIQPEHKSTSERRIGWLTYDLQARWHPSFHLPSNFLPCSCLSKRMHINHKQRGLANGQGKIPVWLEQRWLTGLLRGQLALEASQFCAGLACRGYRTDEMFKLDRRLAHFG